MKVTIEISDELFRKSKTTARAEGKTLTKFITEALAARVASTSETAFPRSGWRSVFGLVEPKTVEGIDALLAVEFEQVDYSEWRGLPKRTRKHHR